MLLDFIPLILSQIKTPQIAQFLIFVVVAVMHVKFSFINHHHSSPDPRRWDLFRVLTISWELEITW